MLTQCLLAVGVPLRPQTSPGAIFVRQFRWRKSGVGAFGPLVTFFFVVAGVQAWDDWRPSFFSAAKDADRQHAAVSSARDPPVLALHRHSVGGSYHGTGRKRDMRRGWLGACGVGWP